MSCQSTNSLTQLIKLAVESIQTAGKPYFRAGDLMEVETETEWLNQIASTQSKKYPFIYMNTDYDAEWNEEEGWYETDLDLWIINRSEVNQNALSRDVNEMPALRTIRINLLRAIEMKCYSFDKPQPKELFFNKNTTELDSPVNVIRLRLSGLKYQLKCLT